MNGGATSRRLSVAMVCFPGYGGSGLVAAELAAALARRGHDVHVVATARPRRLPADDARLHFHAVHLPTYPALEHVPYELGLASTLMRLDRAHELDLVHAHYALPHAASAWLARQASAKLRTVVTLHGTDVTHIGADPSYSPALAFTVARADALTAPSRSLAEQARARFALPPSASIEVLSNFVDTTRFAPVASRSRAHFQRYFARPDGEAPVLLHASNFRAVKRVPDLIELAARLRAERPVRLILVGDGPERRATEELVAARGLGEAVAFVGPTERLEEDLPHADLFVLASDSESFGLAALEAMSCGVPVVAYDVGGLRELVTPETGRLVPVADLAALVAAAAELLRDPPLRARTGEAARARAIASYQVEPAVSRYEALYAKVLAEERS